VNNTNKIIDLHIHSNFSEDADLSVKEIFELAVTMSLSAIAIADHDSIHSIEKADSIKNNYPVEYIPGIEITTVFPADNSQQHILGYYVNNKNPELLECVEKIGHYRNETAKKRIQAFKKLNFSLDEDKIHEATGERPAGPVLIISEIFRNENNKKDKRLEIYLNGEKSNNKIANFYKDYLTENSPAHVPFISISTQEGIDIIKKAGGVPVLAHPIYVKNKDFLNVIKEMGIAGLEAISTYHKPDDIAFYLDYASKNGLLITAGSDFHGPTAKPNIKLGAQDMQPGKNFSYFEKLKELHNQSNS
jgi:3',5'-nucleoside bisphosphate phosphatase